MAPKLITSRSRSLLLAAVAIAVVVVGVNFLAANNVMTIQSGTIMFIAAKGAQTSTNVTVNNLYGQLDHFSRFIVETPEIRELLLQARVVVESYGEYSLQALELRRQVRARAREIFFDKAPELSQLHVSFFIGEDPSLFLQLNPPDTPAGAGRGANTLAKQAAASLKPVRGLYADAAYAGLRTATPLLIMEHSDADAQCVGVVEIGVDLESLVYQLLAASLSDKQRPGAFAALLKQDIAERAFTPERLAGMQRIQLANGPYYLLGKTSQGQKEMDALASLSEISPLQDIGGAFTKEMFPDLDHDPKRGLLRSHFAFSTKLGGAATSTMIDGLPVGFVAFPLPDEQALSGQEEITQAASNAVRATGDRLAENDAVILSWAPFPDIKTLHEHLAARAIVKALVWYILILLVSYATWRFESRKLRRLIEQRTAELAAAEQRYRGIYENAVQGMFQTKPEGRYLSVNPAYAAMLGYTQQEMLDILAIGDTLFADPAQREALSVTLEKGGVMKNYEMDMMRKDGALLHTLFNARAFLDADGAPVFEGIVMDNTARKDAEERLKKSEETYRSILETTSEGFLLMDVEFRILDVNESFIKLLGFERNELLGRQPVEFGTEQTRAFILKNMRQLRQAAYRNFEGAYVAKDGREIPVQVNSNALHNDKGEVVGQVAFVSDISERKRSEELREDVERMARHDLKTPLNAVINLPQIVMADENLNPEHIECLNMIQDAGYRMLDMINLSLNLFKMECGTYHFTPRYFDILPLLRRVIADLGSLSEAKSVPVQLHVGEPLDPEASCDLGCMIQGEELLCYSMFANLIKNALEATPDSGQPVTVTCEIDSGQRISIHNEGAIPDEIRDKFFLKYATAGKQGGTGLGTYSAWLIAKTHHAGISVSSSVAQGTTVSVLFSSATL